MQRKAKASTDNRRPDRSGVEMHPSTIEEFFRQQQRQDQLRVIVCGGANYGKSTLVGRLLWESQKSFDDPPAARKVEPGKFANEDDSTDSSVLLDGLAAEREQARTSDLAYRFFTTAKRRFIIADTPVHEQCARTMVAGASTAAVAVLLVDAGLGVLTQTRRHAYLASLMGIRHAVLAVNKMDVLRSARAIFDRAVFDRIQASFFQFVRTLGFESVAAIPLSALKGDNVIGRSANTPWYAGPTLMGCLEAIEVKPRNLGKLVFPVQWVNRPDSSFRGYSGSVAEGRVMLGDEIRVTGSGEIAAVAEILTMDGSLAEAVAGDAVTLRLDREIDAARGDVFSLRNSPLETTDQFEATLVWMNEEPGLVGRVYDIKLATQWASASITNIKHRVDIDTLAHEASKHLSLNDISICNIATSAPIVFDAYQNSKTLGGFILADRISHATVAAGMIRHTLRRSQNVHKQALSITRQDRERLNGHKGKVIWFTGLSGSGKSTIANALEMELYARGRRTYLLDGDNVRQGLNKDLGFTDADRVENIRRIAELAKLMMDAGLIVMTAFISPFRREREMARELIGSENFIETYVSTPLAVCEQRDPKGLYKKARSGQLPNMTGVSSPYEAPEQPDVALDCSNAPLDAGVKLLIDALQI